MAAQTAIAALADVADRYARWRSRIGRADQPREVEVVRHWRELCRGRSMRSERAAVMAAIVARRAGLHRPVEVADHVLEDGKTGGIGRRQSGNRETLAQPGRLHPVAACDVVDVLDEETVAARDGLAAAIAIVDLG